MIERAHVKVNKPEIKDYSLPIQNFSVHLQSQSNFCAFRKTYFADKLPTRQGKGKRRLKAL